MALRSSDFKFCLILALVFCLSGCLDSGPGSLDQTSTLTSSPSTTTSSSGTISDYQNALSVKVLFKKASFYNNDNPNPLGCAGDARAYYDPGTSRQVPVAPTWIKNISVDITNSNSFNGPSSATTCGLSGVDAPPPINCASFDDLQPTDGNNSRSVLIGGIGCTTDDSSCSPTTSNAPLADIWNLNVPGTTTSSTWSSQPVALLQPVIWGAGDYDELHDLFYIYGGATPNGGNLKFQKSVTKVSFSSDRSVSSTFPPVDVSSTISTNMSYAGWLISSLLPVHQALVPSSPPAMVGSTFTYGLRRDPTFKTWYSGNDTAGLNQTAYPGIPDTARETNEEGDYFLLAGGMLKNGEIIPTYNGNNVASSGMFSKDLYMYKPHGFSDDAADIDSNHNALSDGDWNLLSFVERYESTISIANIGITGNSKKPYAITTGGNHFIPWSGRAYHRTVYDPYMNRFYIYGGLVNAVDGGGSPISAVNTPPTVTSDLWIYDPPALGRRPTEACNTNLTPDQVSLQTDAYVVGGKGGIMAGQSITPVSKNIGINENYLTEKLVFPPGGCLQHMNLPATPPSRFEHSMAFDRNQKAMLVFGGCQNAAQIADDGTPTAGDPSVNCASSTSLLDDTWLYIPPVITEVIPKSQYSATSILTNIFNIDFWLQSLPLFVSNNPDAGTLTTPTIDQAMGAWINLTPTTIRANNSPTKRMSASISYDRAHHKFYLYGGYGCQDSDCATIGVLNDLWEFTPPQIAQSCTPSTRSCSDQGSWAQIQTSSPTQQSQPFSRRGAIMAYAQPNFSYGDEFYTVSDSSCIGEGPISSADPAVNKQLVGSIYIDVNRSLFGPRENLLINLRLLPFDEKTKLPGWLDFDGILSTTSDDTDVGSVNDKALIRVQILTNPLQDVDQIQAAVQPRYHEYLTGATVLADTLMYVAGPTGQLTDQQILIPLAALPNADMIKIERVQGSVKFFEMTLSKF